MLVPVVIDHADAPRLVALAKLLRTAMADRRVPTVAARYAATLEAATASGDSFAAALDLSGEFATLRYELHSDKLVRAHALRLLELTKAHAAILLAAPMANRIVLQRISRADGQSLALPDPCEPKLAEQALAELLPSLGPRDHVPPRTEHSLLSSRGRNWLLGGVGVTGLGTVTLTMALAAKRRHLGAQFQETMPSDSDYLTRGDDWRALRTPMLASASVASASLSLTAALVASDYDPRKLRWVSVPAAALGLAGLAWASSDLAQGSPCPASAESTCVGAQSRLDRGILLVLASAPLLAVASTHLGRWIHGQLQLHVHASPSSPAVSVAYLH